MKNSLFSILLFLLLLGFLTYADISFKNLCSGVIERCDDLEENFIKEWKSAKECNDLTGIQRSKISDVCRGKRKQTGGYIFRYKDAC